MTPPATVPSPPRARLRTEQKAATRRRLMNAAMQVMAEKGYAAATVEEIASLAGASPATFYLHFKRKIDVLTAVVEDENSQITANAGPLPRPGVDLDVVSFKGWIERLFATWKMLVVPHQVLGQAVLIEPELKALQTRRLTEGIRYWEEFLEQCGVPRGKRRRAEAAVLNAQFVGLFEIWIVTQIELDAKLLTDTLTESVWQRLTSMPGSRVESGVRRV